MNKDQAVALLSKVKTVEEWNQVREGIKDKCTQAQWMALIPTIDGSGLIVEILGRGQLDTVE